MQIKKPDKDYIIIEILEKNNNKPKRLHIVSMENQSQVLLV